MGLILFFLANMCCAGQFDIPSTWYRHYGTDEGVHVPTTTPGALTAFILRYKKPSDIIVLEDHRYAVKCVLAGATTALGGGSVFAIEGRFCGADDIYNGFVFSSPTSNSLGKVLFVRPKQSKTVSKEFSLACDEVPHGAAPEYFCAYSAQPDHFTVNRFLWRNPDDSQFFVGVTLWYSQLEKVTVSYGTKSRDGHDIPAKVWHLEYDFT